MSTRAHPPATTYEHSSSMVVIYFRCFLAQVIASQPADREGNDGSRARAGESPNEAGKGAESHEDSKNSDEASKKGDESQTQGKGDEGRHKKGAEGHEEGSAETVDEATTTTKS